MNRAYTVGWVLYLEILNTRCVSFVVVSKSSRADHDETYTMSVHYFSVDHEQKKKKNIEWAIYYTILEAKSKMDSNSHFWPPPFECACLLSVLLRKLNPQQKED